MIAAVLCLAFFVGVFLFLPFSSPVLSSFLGLFEHTFHHAGQQTIPLRAQLYSNCVIACELEKEKNSGGSAFLRFLVPYPLLTCFPGPGRAVSAHHPSV